MPDAGDLANDILYPEGDTSAMAMAAPKIDGRTRAGRAARAASPGAPPPRRGPGRPSTKPKPKDYRAGVEGIGQLAAGALLFVNHADAAAVMVHTPPIAQALHDLAQEDPRVAALLDKLLQVGPYGALLAAVAPLVLQVLCNHGKVPTGLLGTVAPEQLVEAVVGGQ